VLGKITFLTVLANAQMLSIPRDEIRYFAVGSGGLSIGDRVVKSSRRTGVTVANVM
jgi:hypothetical protein